MTKPLQSNKRLAALIIALFMGIGTAQAEYDFAAACNTGQTLYYQITDFTNFYVSIVAPGNSSEWWPENTVKPANMIVIPQTVSYGGIDFTVTSIANNAFYTCDGLTVLLQVPNTVTSIGNHAFYGCSSLRIANIPNSINSIGYYAFYGCNSLTSITIPNSVRSIRSSAFQNCTGLTSMVVATGNTVYDSRDNCNAIIRTATNTLVAGCKNTLIPNSVTSIGEEAFYDCTGLTSIEIPNSVTSIGGRAFWGCTGLTSVEIPNSVISIGDDAFYNCTGLTSVEIPNSVISIGNDAFYNCTGLTSVEIGNSVTYIGFDAFSGCTGLTSIEIPNSVTIIDYGAFSGCTGLTSVTIGNSVTSIGIRAFDGCTGLTSVTIGNSVTSIEDYAFNGCSGLTSVYYTGDVAQWCGISFGYYGGANPLSYGHNLYINNELVTALVIPNSVTSINAWAFYNCSSLTSVEIPNSVTLIGIEAFRYCSGLNEITMLRRTEAPLLGDDVFYNTNNCPIYVPYESLNNYKTSCSNYASRIYPMAYTAVSGYGTGGGKWKFIASPLTANTAPTAVSNMTTTAYDLYRFNQSAELEWENYKANSFSSLTNGQGYLYANKEDVNLVFKGTFNGNSSKNITLTYDEGKDFAGWNLVGNPFPVQAYANRSYYTMNEEGTGIEPTAASTSTAIPACTGVMVKAETTGQSVTFSKTAPSAATNNGALQIAVAQANTRGAAVQDKAIVSFNAGDELGKFYFGESNAKLYIPQNGKELAIATTAKTSELPINFKATKNGEYTITVNPENVELDYLHLIDNLTGADVDLLVSPEYTFNAKTSDYASRFRLVFSTICEDANGDNETFAFIDAGGNIVINGEGTLQVIDVTGRVIVSRDGVHTVSTNGMVPGMYILRLINGENVM